MVYNNIIDLIGNTPLLSLKESTGFDIYAKAEFLNPGGSIKDRPALNMIIEAEKEGVLKKGMTIVEPTSGNTGIGLALVGIRRGYKVIIVMPENMSEERKKIIKCLGAKLVLTPAVKSIDGSVKEAERIVHELGKNGFMPQQFTNKYNPLVHYKTTAVELVKQVEKNIDIFVSGLGSGGTLQGIGMYIKEIYPDAKVVAVEPKDVSALLGDQPGLHQIQGIGDGFIPEILDTNLIDEVVTVTDNDAIETTRNLARIQGIMCGTSSGANIWAAMQMAKKYGKDKTIVTVLPDRMERYFSTGLLD
ncbi:MAG: cysteine synthase A [Paludibacteraceae bacterium]|nr:cysteine synthase A [Paludibacteraceae bacterium]